MQPPQRSLAESGVTFVLFIALIVVSVYTDRQSGGMWFYIALFLATAPMLGFIRGRDKGEFAYLQADDFFSPTHWGSVIFCSIVTGCVQLMSGLDSIELFWVADGASLYQLIIRLAWGIAAFLLIGLDTIRSRRRGIFSRVAIAALKNLCWLYGIIMVAITIQNQHS